MERYDQGASILVSGRLIHQSAHPIHHSVHQRSGVNQSFAMEKRRVAGSDREHRAAGFLYSI